MTAENILLSLGERIEVWKIPNGEVAVSYEHCEVKEGYFLKGTYGTGKTFEDACEAYLNEIHGKTLVFNAYSGRRNEVRVL